MPSTDGRREEGASYDAGERRLLLAVAARSIVHGLGEGAPLRPDPRDYPPPMRAARATFVTLELDAALRGCIGALGACRPLVEDVARNAFAAAFEDPRFPPLAPQELGLVTVQVSVLSPPEPLCCRSPAELLAQLRPGTDGLILEDRGHRGTFLPSVWDQLPEPVDFLTHLYRKASLPAGHWSDSLVVSRYTTESFAAPAAELLEGSGG